MSKFYFIDFLALLYVRFFFFLVNIVNILHAFFRHWIQLHFELDMQFIYPLEIIFNVKLQIFDVVNQS